MSERDIAEILGWRADSLSNDGRWGYRKPDGGFTTREVEADDMAAWLTERGHIFRLELNEFGRSAYTLTLPRVRNLRLRIIKADTIYDCFERAVRLVEARNKEKP